MTLQRITVIVLQILSFVKILEFGNILYA